MDKTRRNSDADDGGRGAKGTASSYSCRILSWFSSVRGILPLLGPIRIYILYICVHFEAYVLR